MTAPLDPLDRPITAREASDLGVELRSLGETVQEQGRFGKWNRRLIVLLAVIVAAVLVLGVFVWRSAAYAQCSADRTKALTGPSTERINLFFQAYTEAAGQIDHPLSDTERARIVDGLLRERETFTVLPARAKLEDAPDTQLLAYRDLIAALHANEVYNATLADHPVCSFWGV